MFCQCYFATKPAAHASHEGHGDMAAEHYCRANNVFRVNKGEFKGVKLDGAKFWLAMDLGDDFSDGTMKWCIITFDPAVKKDQRDAIATILSHLYPVKWEEPLQVRRISRSSGSSRALAPSRAWMAARRAKSS
jgi:hypothetical protein